MSYLTEVEDMILENEAHDVMIDLIVVGRDEWHKLLQSVNLMMYRFDSDLRRFPICREKVQVMLEITKKSFFQPYTKNVDVYYSPAFRLTLAGGDPG